MHSTAKFLLILLALLAFPTADFAQTPPPSKDVYGAYPTNYQELITAWLHGNLMDPKNMQLKWLSEPRAGELEVNKGQVVSGFLVDFSIKARNIFGLYTGAQKHTALIRDGQVVTATGFTWH